MKRLVSVVLLSVTACAQGFTAVPSAPAASRPPPRFWTRENKVEIASFAALVAADGVTTQRGLNQGLRELNPVMRPFAMRGAGGQAVGSALGFGAGVGVVYFLHRSHHYKAERVAMRLLVVDESGFVINNIVAIH